MIKSLLLAAFVGFVSAVPLASTDTDPFLSKRAEKRGTGNCANTDNLAPITSNGDAATGAAFCETDWGNTYVPITNLTVWYNQYNINGIQATYADGTQSQVYGKAAYTEGTIGVDYAQGQRWSSWNTWFWPPQYSYGDDYLTSIDISVSNGQSVDWGMPQYTRQQNGLQPYPVGSAVGSGILVGFNGTSDGTAINSLAPMFLNSDVANIQISDLQFPYGAPGSQNIGIDSLASSHYYNGQTTGATNWQFQDQEALQSTYMFSQTATYMYGQTVAFTFGIMLMVVSASNTDTFTWTQTYATVHANTYQTTNTISWQQSGTLQPGQGVDVRAVVGHGQGTFPYTSTVTISLKNGAKYTYTEAGTITIDDISQAVVDLTTNNNP